MVHGDGSDSRAAVGLSPTLHPASRSSVAARSGGGGCSVRSGLGGRRRLGSPDEPALGQRSAVAAGDLAVGADAHVEGTGVGGTDNRCKGVAEGHIQ
jgi:hypothetical protein